MYKNHFYDLIWGLEIWLLLWLFVSNQGHEHDFKEDWGEQLVGKHKLALNILDLNSGDIDTLDTIPEDLSVGQVTQKEKKSCVV